LPTADDEEFRRMAELLHHLGLQAELADLLAIAKESDDSDIREVAADFSPYGMSSLQVILSRLEESDEDQTIYAAEPWNPESDALLAIEGNPEADAALDAGLRYFIEVSIAQDVIETWIHWRNGRIPTPLEIANAVIFYATNDSYLLP